MNDSLHLCLDYDPTSEEELEKIKKLSPRIDALMKEHGWRYTGLRNMYRAIDGTDSDETYYAAEQAFEGAEWLKDLNPSVQVGIWTNADHMDQIIIRDMLPPSEEKMRRYADYLQKNHRYVHGIIVDENHVLRDGYTTYLLAKESNKTPQIMRVRSGQVFKKTVCGKIGDKYDLWYYEIQPAVLPGDILLVETDDGPKEICVEEIGYAAGPHDCSIHKRVLEHRRKGEDQMIQERDIDRSHVVPKEMFVEKKETVVKITELGFAEYRIRDVLKDYRKLVKVVDALAIVEGPSTFDNLVAFIEEILPVFPKLIKADGENDFEYLHELVMSDMDDQKLIDILLGKAPLPEQEENDQSSE